MSKNALHFLQEEIADAGVVFRNISILVNVELSLIFLVSGALYEGPRMIFF